ncbi:hypothetical protein LOZ12_004177 [Ophidiomyces ophidiicola]|uniref:Uncharacterized protein n=1 Tax=Ophidiomyces ophidiicola TaxID=1387563 RepID=A0ACB8UQY4_9EURO|nr:uncharacterized protein LOZ57_006288 [Ophidiomyces ophidiicola]KAI1907830.1 hypothetical protein LOZ64_005730 [Ophidiomyces ophidiicola]KAI1937094.1 hypothetical protein LOZ62_005529 [Ophidiomyces ophidiicola]KAI1938742.1 hypothetical protein LOZ57_006288 [Ophidiomyces ophidiicola]KAI1951528.1 hypothetical protein LOZ59_005618 [Ophidiomyces ophidiicola]KAI2004383.1 hypothetical protein LOZ50_004326 [Ophidiomyces ophidiicola]
MDSSENTPGIHTPGTPPRPPYSPVTPVMMHANLRPIPELEKLTPPPATAAAGKPLFLPPSDDTPQLPATMKTTAANDPMASPPTTFAPEPSPVPISESDNPDAIALRSAIAILQIQKQQALRDIRSLEKMKKVAAESPEAFARELINAAPNQTADMGLFNPRPLQSRQCQGEDGNTTFGDIPKPQNIVRMPPINWSKYHIVGEPLDKLHEEQRRRPFSGEPRRDALPPIHRSPEHFIAAPYRPFTESLDSPMRTRSSNKKKNEPN